MKAKLDIFSPFFFFPFMFITVYFGGYLFASFYLDRIGASLSISPVQYYYYTAALLSYWVGIYISSISLNASNNNQISNDYQYILSKKYFWFFILFMFLICFPVFIYRMYKTGIPFLNFEPNSGRAARNALVSGYIALLSLSTEAILVFCLIYRFILKVKSLLINLLIFLLFFGLFLTGSRNNLIIPTAIFIVCYHYLGKRFSWKQIIVYGVVLITLFTIYGWIRSFGMKDRWENWRDVFNLPASFSPAIPLILSFMNSSLLLSDITNNFPKAVPFQHGKFIFSGIATLLPGHQPTQGVMIVELMNIKTTDPIAISMLGTFWVDFGFQGILIAMFLIGFCLNILYSKIIKSKYELSWTLLYSYSMVYLVKALYSGFLESFIDIWFPCLFFIGAKYMIKKKYNENT